MAWSKVRILLIMLLILLFWHLSNIIFVDASSKKNSTKLLTTKKIKVIKKVSQKEKKIVSVMSKKKENKQRKGKKGNRGKKRNYFEGWTIMTVTAYNAGDLQQCAGNPCISADGSNICEGLTRGEKYVAANFVPLGSLIEIKTAQGKILGLFKVVDRTNSRYKYRVDIAFQKHEKKLARKFGRQRLYVRVVHRYASK